MAGSYLRSLLTLEALPHIKEWIEAIGAALPEEEYERRGETVWVHKTAKVFPSAYLGDHIIIGKDAEVRHCAFLRANAWWARAPWWEIHRIKKCNFCLIKFKFPIIIMWETRFLDTRPIWGPAPLPPT